MLFRSDPTREGTLTITAKGEITQEPGSAITTGTGQVSIQTETAAITLASGGNAFNGPVAARNVGAAAITLFGSGDLRLSRVAMTADRAGTLSLTANGAITQTAGGTITTGTGTVTLKSAFSDITLANASSNAFNGGVSFRAVGATTLTAKGALAIDSGVAPTARLVAEGLLAADNRGFTDGALGNALSHRAQWQACAAEGRPRSIRFRTPDTGRSSFTDAIRGEVEVEWSTISDFVIGARAGVRGAESARIRASLAALFAKVVR